jgi:inner membrane protease subunit 2
LRPRASRSTQDPKKIIIKRVIALEGDIVQTRPPCAEPYVTVPAGHMWVEGDGDETLDSNTYGPVSVRLVTGHITHILWPLRKAGWVRWREHRDTERVQEYVHEEDEEEDA